ncbi:MAG: hypothetical protein ACRCYX_14995 [Dermatophilaceae bacterium]
MAVPIAALVVLWLLIVGVALAWPPRANRIDIHRRSLGLRSYCEVLTHRRRSRRDRSRGDGAWVADFAEVVTVGLRAGLDLGAAATAAAGTPGVVDRAPWLGPRLVEHLASGRGIASGLGLDSWSEHPRAEGSRHTQHLRRSRPSPTSDLTGLAASWRLTERVGASAAEVSTAAAAGVRARVAAQQRASVLLAGPRTSMWLLTALPLGGPLVGTLVGFTPAELYGSRAAHAAAGVGLILTGAGWLWSSRVLARAARPSRTDGTLG